MSATDESVFLSAGVERLRPLLEGVGFSYQPGDEAASSGGPFATGFFRRGDLEIGLIVRDRNRLGCPNYSVGHGYAGHADLLWALGRDGQGRLVEGFTSYAATDGGDPFLAFEADLRDIILPALKESEVNFRRAVARAHRKFQDKLRGKSG
jgi:hypothetical protein